MILSGLIAGLGGGLLRLAPEVLKLVDRGGERKHELAMLDKTFALDKLHAEQGLALARVEADRAANVGDIDLMKLAIEAQGRPTGIGWVDAINSLIRPFLTLYWCVFFYSAVKWAQFAELKAQGLVTAQAILGMWGPDEASIVFAMIGFWFADRAIRGGHSVLK